jgi:ribosomal protein S18 acetylase RimI-like enzyme
MQTFINTLQKKNVSALHLQVGIANGGAIRFYESVGFNRIAEYEKAIAFGIKF